MCTERTNQPDVWIFDLDGTILVSNQFDESCFEEAIREVLPGLTEVDTDWGAYPDATDAVIFRSLVEQAAVPVSLRAHFSRRFRERFGARVSAHISLDALQPAEGIEQVLRERASSGLGAIATGGFGSTAIMKLRVAGFSDLMLPIRSCDTADRRVDIIAAAARSLGIDWDDEQDRRRVVYFGDGLWDRSACEEAGIRFVGVALEEKAERRLKEGNARPVIQGFSDVERLAEAVREAGEVLAAR